MNLIVQVILVTLSRWVERHKGRFPKRLYIHVDGGSEIANWTVLALLEFLVSKRMVTEFAVFLRNPPGHTHGPVDGRFSNVRALILHQSVPTLDCLKSILERSGAMEGVTDIVFLHVLPNWTKFFRPSLDPKLASAHQEEVTQLQWKFEAVVPDVLFPFGCRTTYRAAPMDVAWEIKKVNPDSALMEIGRLTGLDPIEVFYTEYPQPSTYPERNVLGMHLLRTMPHGDIEPKAVVAGCAKAMRLALACIREHYPDEHNTTRLWWESWVRFKTDNIDDYLREYPHLRTTSRLRLSRSTSSSAGPLCVEPETICTQSLEQFLPWRVPR